MTNEQLMTIVEADIPYEAPKAVDYLGVSEKA